MRALNVSVVYQCGDVGSVGPHFFQVGSLAVAWGWAMAFFEVRGISRRTLFIASVVFALLPFNGILLVTLWKDIPYTITNFILVFLLGFICMVIEYTA